jgi:predicted ATPase/DNA-binding winged helix-turn-helix (wHTH) protein
MEEKVRLTCCSVHLPSGRLLDGRDGVLTPRELELLRYLSARPGQVVPREELMQQVFGYAPTAQSRAVDKSMVTLRKKVELDPAEPDHLRTVSGVGYRFEARRSEPHLPAEHSSLVGRGRELDQLVEQLRSPGLLALVGPGGVGKTRLALAAAHRYARTGRPALFCALADARDAQDIVLALAGALGVPLGAGEGQLAQLGRALAARPDPLIVLDNLEHLLEHAGVALALRQMAPEARLLLTSRETPSLPGCRISRLAPLPADEAVELLRTRAAELGFLLGEEQEGLPELAERLDHLPLALELAAPWLGLLEPRALAERLRPSAEPGLRQMLDKSWELLEPPEREALAELSVFRGGFTVSAAEAVLEQRTGRRALPLLDRLLRASLVQRTSLRAAVRLSLLETVRAYASLRLDEDPAARQRAELAHARHFATHGQDAGQHLTTELDNVVEACRTATAHGEGELAVDCLTALTRVLGFGGPDLLLPPLAERALELPLEGETLGRALAIYGFARIVQGALEEGERRLNESLPLLERHDTARTWALCELGRLHLIRGRQELGERYLQQARDLATTADQRALALSRLSLVLRERGELAQAAALCRDAFELFSRAGNRLRAEQARINLGIALFEKGDLQGARAAYEAAQAGLLELGATGQLLDVRGCLANLAYVSGDGEEHARRCAAMVADFRAIGVTLGVTQWLSNLGFVLTGLGRLEEARDALAEAKHLAAEAGYIDQSANIANHLGQLRLAEGDLAEAEAEIERSCTLFDRCGDRYNRIDAMCTLARVRVGQGRSEQAAQILDEAAQLCAELGLAPTSVMSAEVARTRTALSAS